MQTIFEACFNPSWESFCFDYCAQKRGCRTLQKIRLSKRKAWSMACKRGQTTNMIQYEIPYQSRYSERRAVHPLTSRDWEPGSVPAAGHRLLLGGVLEGTSPLHRNTDLQGVADNLVLQRLRLNRDDSSFSASWLGNISDNGTHAFASSIALPTCGYQHLCKSNQARQDPDRSRSSPRWYACASHLKDSSSTFRSPKETSCCAVLRLSDEARAGKLIRGSYRVLDCIA